MDSRIPLLVVVALASCQAPFSTDATTVDTSFQATDDLPQNAITVAEVGSLAGEWRVAGIDGRPLDQPVGIALRANDREIWWDPRCAGMARLYRIDGQQISFTSAEPPRPKEGPTPPVCAIGLPPQLRPVFQALDEATTVSRAPSNGLTIAGPRHNVTLFSQ